MWHFDPEHGVHSLLHAMLTRHKPHANATNRRFRPESALNRGPYRTKSQHCGRHTIERFIVSPWAFSIVLRRDHHQKGTFLLGANTSVKVKATLDVHPYVQSEIVVRWNRENRADFRSCPWCCILASPDRHECRRIGYPNGAKADKTLPKSKMRAAGAYRHICSCRGYRKAQAIRPWSPVRSPGR